MAEPTVSFLDTTKAVIIAGLLGSLLSLGFIDGMGKRQRVVAVISGIVLAHYLTPLIAVSFNEPNYQETIGFLVGLFGMSIVASLFRAIHKSDLWGLFKRRYSPPSDVDTNGGMQ